MRPSRPAEWQPKEAKHPRRRSLVAISISTPAVIAIVIALLWVGGNLDGTLSNLGLPGLTHACVAADNSVSNALRCVLYKAQAQATAQHASSSTTATSTAAPTVTTAASSPSTTTTHTSSPAALPKLAAADWDGIKPATIDISGDAGNIITNIRWTSWTANHAAGIGTSTITSCVPSCATGSAKSATTTIGLTQPSGGVFTLLTETRGGTTTTYTYGTATWVSGAS